MSIVRQALRFAADVRRGTSPCAIRMEASGPCAHRGRPKLRGIFSPVAAAAKAGRSRVVARTVKADDTLREPYERISPSLIVGLTDGTSISEQFCSDECNAPAK